MTHIFRHSRPIQRLASPVIVCAKPSWEFSYKNHPASSPRSRVNAYYASTRTCTCTCTCNDHRTENPQCFNIFIHPLVLSSTAPSPAGHFRTKIIRLARLEAELLHIMRLHVHVDRPSIYQIVFATAKFSVSLVRSFVVAGSQASRHAAEKGKPSFRRETTCPSRFFSSSRQASGRIPSEPRYGMIARSCRTIWWHFRPAAPDRGAAGAEKRVRVHTPDPGVFGSWPPGTCSDPFGTSVRNDR